MQTLSSPSEPCKRDSTLQATPTSELERLARAYAVAVDLNVFERSAILARIRAELASRSFAADHHFKFTDERDLRGILVDALKYFEDDARENEHTALMAQGEVILLKEHFGEAPE